MLKCVITLRMSSTNDTQGLKSACNTIYIIPAYRVHNIIIMHWVVPHRMMHGIIPNILRKHKFITFPLACDAVNSLIHSYEWLCLKKKAYQKAKQWFREY